MRLGRHTASQRGELRSRTRQRGQAIVEFVLILPVLLALASIVIDLGNMVFITHRMSAAAREGARIATETTVPAPTNPGESDQCTLAGCQNSNSICCIAVNRSNLVLFNSGVQNADVTGRWYLAASGGQNYSMFQVQIQSNVNFFFGLGNQTLTSSSVAYGEAV